MPAPAISALPELPTFPPRKGLPDQPGAFIPKALAFLEALRTYRVEANALASYLEGLSVGGGSSAWGGITGTLEDQTDLTAHIAAQIATLVDAAPGALDTLNELAAALGDDASFAATVTTALAGKQPLNSILTALAGLSLSQGDILYRDASGLQRLPAGTAGQYLQTNGTGADPAWATVAGGSGSLLGRQVITSGSGTYTPTAGTNSVIVEVQGAGGGGSGVVVGSGSQGSRASSGGGGGYVMKRMLSDFSGATYSIGTGGNGGAAGANAGAAGGDTTFTDTAANAYVGGGGAGGGYTAPTNGIQIGSPTDGGTATGGDVNIPGSPAGCPLIGTTGGGGYSAPGGPSRFSSGAKSARQTAPGNSEAGHNADGYGGGGSAAYNCVNGAARAGGNGSDGLIVIWEYS